MSTNDARLARLRTERKNWNKARPFGFKAKPQKRPDGTLDLGLWIAQIPGPKHTAWEDGVYTVRLEFPANYPRTPPKARFTPAIFHPNVYGDGEVCLTLINPRHWAAGTSVTEVLKGLSTFLAEPNAADPANAAASAMMKSNMAAYQAKVRAYAKSTVA